MASRSERLFNYIRQISDNIALASNVFDAGIQNLTQVQSFAEQMKDLERKGDRLVSEIVSLLNTTYVTPLEREDFLAIGSRMDDIVDGLEACSVRLDVYNVHTATSTMTALSGLIKECVAQIGQAIELLCNRQLSALHPFITRVHEVEKSADEVLRDALRSLFRNPADPIEVIKFKEIYEILEGVTDRCKDVAYLLESVVVKNT